MITTADGATAHTAHGSTFAPSQRAAVVDTVGAGDSFCGGMLAWLHEAGVRTRESLAEVDTGTWATVLDSAARVAAVTVGRVGADPPRRHEVPDVVWP